MIGYSKGKRGGGRRYRGGGVEMKEKVLDECHSSLNLDLLDGCDLVSECVLGFFCIRNL